MSDTIWQFIGVGLLIWVVFDLFAGHTWLRRKYVRSKEPLGYWIILMMWLLFALWSLGVF
ncbi:hypothetical protein [Microbulbifer spongiae]|uniref:Cardiolipin synthase N-terminal domain-containing protein n=1 Tax=Microbulbifer spongiae TaxID=2944933 RepID=A0ABY9EHF9_9GAMM|nr:hypothetical protein [Microbulbifer sp. MI-G]WKD51149.1 hypothetical protein M8T91_06975 [Microbulbifer sp. MI-G]